MPLCDAAVEADVEGPGQERVGSAPGRQPGGVESVAPGDENAECVTAEGVRSGEVEHPGPAVRGPARRPGSWQEEVPYEAADFLRCLEVQHVPGLPHPGDAQTRRTVFP